MSTRTDANKARATKAGGSGCCDSDAQSAAKTTFAASDDVRTLVREKYGELASARDSSSCCGTGVSRLNDLGYTAEQAEAIPEGANLGLGCGNPLAHAQIQSGETVLDLGSGAGIDAFLAAREVGPSGRVIGVDMTSEMLVRARENAAKVHAENVEFRLGEIEHLPVADESIDLIISNCVINLSPDKPQVFREALRALKPGGRLVVSDIVLEQPLPDEVRSSVEAYVGCVAGASLRHEYLQALQDAGFKDVEVLEEQHFPANDESLPNDAMRDAAKNVVSAKIRAWKR